MARVRASMSTWPKNCRPALGAVFCTARVARDDGGRLLGGRLLGRRAGRPQGDRTGESQAVAHELSTIHRWLSSGRDPSVGARDGKAVKRAALVAALAAAPALQPVEHPLALRMPVELRPLALLFHAQRECHEDPAAARLARRGRLLPGGGRSGRRRHMGGRGRLRRDAGQAARAVLHGRRGGRGTLLGGSRYGP